MKRIFPSPDSIRNFFGHRQSSREQTRQQRGSIMILTTVTIMGMVGMLALAVDLGYLFSSRTQLQNGVNAAALAGAAGLRVTIEADTQAPEQKKIAESLAVLFGNQNQVRRFQDPADSNDPNPNNLDIEPSDVTVDTVPDIPTVRVNKVLPARTLFAGAFGLDSVDISAAAKASVFPVDGGIGTMGAGTSRGGGCWRPLFLPDTFYNSSNNPVIVGKDAAGVDRVPSEPGDYYRSRFAGGARNTFPFVDPIGGAPLVTGLRDTQLQADTGTMTIMGQQPDVIFDPRFYFIADFSSLPRSTFDVRSARDLADFGYCGNIRVGMDIPVFPIGDQATHEGVKLGLDELLNRTLRVDAIDIIQDGLFRYITSNAAPAPNTHGAIIPVLLYNPVIWKDDGNARATMILKVTNIGLFFLRDVKDDGRLQGYFVREIIAGGTPIDPINMAGVNVKYLPMAIRLLR